MKLLTYNIHHWEGVDGRVDVARVANVVRETGADLITLNEVFDPAYGIDAHTPGPALAAMAEQLGMQAAFAPAMSSQLFEPAATLSPYGNAVLSRWPIVAHAGHHLTPVVGHEIRGLLETRVILPDGHQFTAYATHLDHRSEAVRLTQVQAIASWVSRDRTRPHVVMGDFNALNRADYATPQAWEALRVQMAADGFGLENPLAIARMLKTGYVDAFAAAGQGQGQTHATTHSWGRIDYCFVSPHLSPMLLSCRRWDSDLARLASDHFPVLTELEFP